MAGILEEGVRLEMVSQAIYAAWVASARVMRLYRTGRVDVSLKSDATPVTEADRQSDKAIRECLAMTMIPLFSEEGRVPAYEERRDWDLFWMVDPVDGTKEFINLNGEFTVNIALIEDNKPTVGVIAAPDKGLLYFSVLGRGAFRHEGIDFTIANFDSYDYVALRKRCDYEKFRSTSQKLPLPRDRNRPFTVVRSRSHRAPELIDYLARVQRMYPNMREEICGSSLKFCLVAEGSADCYPRISLTSEWDTAAGQAIVEEAGRKVLDFATRKPIFYNKESLENPSLLVCEPDVKLPDLSEGV